MKKYRYNNIAILLFSLMAFSLASCEQDRDEAPIQNPTPTFDGGEVTFGISDALYLEETGTRAATQVSHTTSQQLGNGITMETTITDKKQALTRADGRSSVDLVGLNDRVLVISVGTDGKVVEEPQIVKVGGTNNQPTLKVNTSKEASKLIFFSYGTDKEPETTWVKKGDNTADLAWPQTYAYEYNKENGEGIGAVIADVSRTEAIPTAKTISFQHVLMAKLTLTIDYSDIGINVLWVPDNPKDEVAIALTHGALTAASLDIHGNLTPTEKGPAVVVKYFHSVTNGPINPPTFFIPDPTESGVLEFNKFWSNYGLIDVATSAIPCVFEPGHSYDVTVKFLHNSNASTASTR
jgi:hypothetical protein